MRYRDQPTVEVEVEIDADPAAIWPHLIDIEFPLRYSAELKAVEWLDGAEEVAVGHRFRGVNHNEFRGGWETVCEVVEHEPGRRWVWQVHGPEGIMATWGFELDPGRRSCTVRQWARMGPAPSGLTPFIEAAPDDEARIISMRTTQWRESITANLEGLRQLLTSSPIASD